MIDDMHQRPGSALLPLVAGTALWELAGRWAALRFFPPLSAVLRSGLDLIGEGELVNHLLASLLGLLAGYNLAAIFGVLLGLLMGRYRNLEYALGFYVNGFLAAPKIALVPVLYAILGPSRLVQVAVIFLSAFFVIAVNTMRGVQTAEPARIEMAMAFGANDRQLFRKVLLPGALPLTMAGLRLAMGHAVKGMISGEMFIALFGLGGMLRTYGNRFDAEKVFAILLIVIAVGLACSYAVNAAERRVTGWLDR